MDNRLKFLYLMQTELWGHGRVGRAGKGKTGSSIKTIRGGKSLRRCQNVMRSELIVAKLPNPCRQEKPLLFCISPYRKPTQVDEERILRPTGEALLRNSAK
jgi:hypothetical protein